jgi:threonine/homoserine/homoserine lactone efflux protein
LWLKSLTLSYAYAVFTGMILAFGFGPVFFSILQAGIEKGRKAGLQIAAGTCSSDLFLASVAYAGMFSLDVGSEWGFWLKLAGSIILISIGVSQLLSKPQHTKPAASQKLSGIQLFFKGVALNIFNPLNFITWTAIILAIKSRGMAQQAEIMHVLVIISSVFFFEFLLAHYANKLRHYFESQNLKRLKWLVAVIMFLAAGKLLLSL